MESEFKSIYKGLCIGFALGFVVVLFMFDEFDSEERVLLLKIFIPIIFVLAAIPSWIQIKRFVWHLKIKDSAGVLKKLYETRGLTSGENKGREFLPPAEGKIDGITIEAGEENNRFYISFCPKTTIPVDIMICSENRWDIDDKYKRGDVPGLKGDWYCYSEYPGILQGALDEESIKILSELSLHASYVCLTDKEMFIYPHPHILRSYSSMDNLLEKALTVVKKTRDTYAFWSRFEDRALNAPEAEHRISILNAFGHAIIHDDLRDEKKSIFKKALNDTDVSVQIAAASHLGYKGKQHVKNIIKRAEELGSSIQFTLAEFLFEKGTEKDLDSLWQLFEKAHSEKLRIEILEHVKYNNDKLFTSKEDKKKWVKNLIPFLEKSETALVIGIIKILGAIGTIETVEALYNKGKAAIDPRIDKAINQAIDTIQAGHGKGSEGWLSVAELRNKEGGLSLEDQKGKDGDS